jgi:hypothetical protein
MTTDYKQECDCPYHDLEDCENDGTIRVPGYGWFCSECYDDLDEALVILRGAHANVD